MAYDPPTEYPAQEYLLSMLAYDPLTGDLRWRLTKGRRHKGELAGYFNPVLQRRRVRIHGRLWYSYDIIWCMMTGHFPRWPAEYVDHKDVYGPPHGIGDRWENLRLATHMENLQNKRIQKNNKSGYPGVRQLAGGRWHARIKADHIDHTIGTFDTRDLAIAARKDAERRLFGEFQAQHPEATP